MTFIDKNGYTVEEYFDLLKDVYFESVGYPANRTEKYHPEDIGVNVKTVNNALMVALSHVFYRERDAEASL